MSQSCKGLTRPNNIHSKMTGIVRRFSRRRNMSSNRTDYCYTIIGTEFKGKYILEQDELFCCAIISSGLKEKKNKNKCLSFSPPWEFQTPISSSKAPDPSLLLGDLGLLINLPWNWLSHSYYWFELFPPTYHVSFNNHPWNYWHPTPHNSVSHSTGYLDLCLKHN